VDYGELLFRFLGDYSGGEAVFRQVLDEQLRSGNPSNSNVSLSRVILSLIFMNTGRYDEARQMLDAALKDAQTTHDANNDILINVSIVVGRLLTMQGRYAEAQAIADPAFARQQGLAASATRLHCEEEMAMEYALQGRLDLAERSLRHLLSVRPTRSPADSTAIAPTVLS